MSIVDYPTKTYFVSLGLLRNAFGVTRAGKEVIV